MKLYVANIPFEIREEELQDLFESVGSVKRVSLIKDRETGNPRGFGFVEMTTDALAQEAIRQLNDSPLGNRRIRVEEAQEKPRESGGYNRDPGRGRSHRSGERPPRY